jgi:hypothetical protein
LEVKMHRTLLGTTALLAALAFGAAPAAAQAPVVLVCNDGTTQPGSSRVACGDHQGMDWDATRVWSEMRAGRYMTRDTVVCSDGQAKPAAATACSAHGGVDSASTLASLRRRAQARRFVQPTDSAAAPAGYRGGDQAADTAAQGSDSTRWGYHVDRAPQHQNPPGYRGLERPKNLPAASQADSSAPADATSRINQRQRQDSLGGRDQNPPGYRGMERPAPSRDSAGLADSAGVADSAGAADQP